MVRKTAAEFYYCHVTGNSRPPNILVQHLIWKQSASGIALIFQSLLFTEFIELQRANAGRKKSDLACGGIFGEEKPKNRQSGNAAEAKWRLGTWFCRASLACVRLNAAKKASQTSLYSSPVATTASYQTDTAFFVCFWIPPATIAFCLNPLSLQWFS